MNRLLFILVLLIPCAAMGYGSPAFVPDGAHPRIWLSGTVLSDVRAKQAANSTEWAALESWCDAHIDTTGYDLNNHAWEGGYQGSAYKTYLTNFGMAYQGLKIANPTKAATYAAYAIQILDGMVSGFSAGEESDGIRMIRQWELADRTVCDAEAADTGVTLASYKEGYAARNFGQAMAIGYDWFYAELSPSQRAKYQAVMYRWIDWYRGVRSAYNNGILKNGIRYHEDANGVCDATNKCPAVDSDDIIFKHHYGYHYDNAGTNYWGGYFLMTTLAAAATYGDNADAATYWDLAKNKLWATDLKPLLQSPLRLKGGDSPEGPYYGSIAFDLIARSTEGIKTAAGESIFDASFRWPADVLASRLHQSYGSLDEMISRGDWSSGYASDRFIESTSRLTPMLRIANDYFPAAPEVGWGKYYLNNGVFATHDVLSAADKLLWNVSGINPASTATTPKDAMFDGSGLVAMRSDWSGTAQSIAAWIDLEGEQRMDHEGYGNGHLLVSRGKDHLLSFRNGSGTSAKDFNNIVFNDTNPLPGYRDNDRTVSSIDRYSSQTDYVYVRGNTANAWDWAPEYPAGVNGVLLNYRSTLYLRNLGIFVVYDVTRSNTAAGTQKDFYTQYESDPAVSTDTVTATVGGSKVFVKTLLPSGTFTKTNPATGFWRIKFTPTTQQEYEQFLHVVEAADSASSQTAAVLVDGTGGRGAVIGGTTVAMFTKDQNCAPIAALTYTVSTTGESTHYIADLVPGAAYDVRVDSGTPATYTASEAGVLSFPNPVSATHTYGITQRRSSTRRLGTGRMTGLLK